MSSEDKSEKVVEALRLYVDAMTNANEVLRQALAKLEKAPTPQSADAEHPEIYDPPRLNWETRTGSQGEFQMIRRDNCSDTALFNHLDAILKANKNNVSIGDWHYWAGETGYIFRRRKKPKG